MHGSFEEFERQVKEHQDWTCVQAQELRVLVYQESRRFYLEPENMDKELTG
jgi:hypothetical protein